MYRTREDEVRAGVSKDEAIRRIIQNGGEYDINGGLDGCFDAWDQLLLCEALAESTPVRYAFLQETHETEEIASGNGSVHGSYKRKENSWLTPEKLEAIRSLKQSDYKTPPIEKERLLGIIFEGYNTRDGWWLAVAQQWTSKSINSVLGYMVKADTERWKSLKNPAAYFSLVIQHHPKQKSIRRGKSL